MAKIAVVFGTRPEAIKMAPVVNYLKKNSNFETQVIVTGQHKEMLEQVISLFAIIPDYNLNIMQTKQSLSDITNMILTGLESYFREERPDILLVHGDTSTAFAATLAAFYQKIPVGHVEAGLRSGDLYNPWPEEANRRLIDSISQLFFAPTNQTADNLHKEGHLQENVFVTGNTVIDAVYAMVDKNYEIKTEGLEKLHFSRPVIVVTAHRRENWGEPLKDICSACYETVRKLDVDLVFAMHKNPQIQAVVKEELGKLPRVHLIDAPSYKDFINLLDRSTLVVTDSGGLQEEAPALNKPVLVLRNTTERPEGIDAGTLKLIGTKKKDIVTEITNILEDKNLYEKMASAVNPYGDGCAAHIICKILEKKLCF